jgi:hypothetical protein
MPLVGSSRYLLSRVSTPKEMQDGSFSSKKISVVFPGPSRLTPIFPRSLLVLNRWMSSSVGLYSKPNMSLGSFRT